MNRVEDKAAARGKNPATAQHLLAYLLGRAKRKHLLRVHASAPKHEALAILRLQILRVHSRCGALHGIYDVDSSFNEGLIESF